MENSNWTIGESVVVKPGVTDPDTGNDIAGWQGRISAIFDEEGTVAIRWDSLTLKSLALTHIAWCEEEGLSWSEMNLGKEEVEPAATRDTEDDVATAIAEIESRSSWLYLGGEQGKRIQEIVNQAQDHKESSIFEIWHAYLKEQLAFTFAARVEEYQSGPVPQGAQVTVVAITSLDDPYGTIVSVRYKGRVYQLPLCDLKATKAADAKIRRLLEDYAVWYANR